MTSDQETRVLAMLSAFEAGKKISELDTASGSVSDMRIEVLDTDGESSYEFVRGGYHRRKRRLWTLLE